MAPRSLELLVACLKRARTKSLFLIETMPQHTKTTRTVGSLSALRSCYS
jgi:hypothetical protein